MNTLVLVGEDAENTLFFRASQSFCQRNRTIHSGTVRIIPTARKDQTSPTPHPFPIQHVLLHLRVGFGLRNFRPAMIIWLEFGFTAFFVCSSR